MSTRSAAWYRDSSETWLYRAAVTIATPAASPYTATIVIPPDFHHFWTTIDSSGNDLRLVEWDATNKVWKKSNYQLAASPAFSKTNRIGTIEADGLAVGTTGNPTCLWLYYGPADGAASSGAGTVTLSSAKSGYIELARPTSGRVFSLAPERLGSTLPSQRFQKNDGETVHIWWDLSAALPERRDVEASHLGLGGVVYADPDVYNDQSATQAAMFTTDSTRFAEYQGRLYVKQEVKAGTSGSDYTVEMKIGLTDLQVLVGRVGMKVQNVILT
jgi:hypothetical protein